ncbi:hypothetical protein [Thermus thermophilus]|uniref:Uncharacterized protein n=2 Tax=Thermus thermophilus TaxID=274 RepID=A0AAD1KWL9_THETH|nr:hypothetical protein [Thermus thermophilus]AFH40117.1 hypothetical protein TtJL18_2286 [Thermus thermophilus JL-18]BBL83448.1 hypothetical protein TthAA220_22320 [Thermus thermophilus]BBL85716.1 hypothetical protein TthAA229_21970 [Thermus thermophilus]BCZ88129.1 hypothetical protein TthAA11_23110 [Thermus thermophilus]
MNRSKWVLWGLGLILALGLVGCGGQGGGDARTVNASLGTWNYGGQNLGLAFVLWADLQAPTIPDGFKVTVTGPSSASPVTYGPFAVAFSTPVFWWSVRSWVVPASGDHTISATLNASQSLNRTFKLEANSTLPQPQNVTVQATQNSATFSWSSVSGAKSYYVELWQLDDQGNPKNLWFRWYTTVTQVQFTQNAGIQLSPGNYRARVFAASVDLTQLLRPGQAAQLDPQINFSSAWSQQAVQVQSVGTLRVVPAPDTAPVLPPEPDVVGRASQ